PYGFRRSPLRPSREPVRHRLKRLAYLLPHERNGIIAIQRSTPGKLNARQALVVVFFLADRANGSDVPDHDRYRQASFVTDDFEEWETAHREPSPRSNSSCTLTLRPRMRRAARVRWSIVESLGSAVPSL